MDDYLFVGSFTPDTDGNGEGIYTLAFDPRTGEHGPLLHTTAAENPNFIAAHPANGTLLAADAGTVGRLAAYRIEHDGRLSLLNSVVTEGSGACHISIAPRRALAATANYWDGSVSVHRLRDDGSVSRVVSRVQHHGRGPDPSRQGGPHAHSVRFSADEKLLFSADLGTDRVYVYAVEPDGQLRLRHAARTSPGAGPRHLIPDNDRLHVACELDSTVETFALTAETGVLHRTNKTATTTNPSATRNYPSEIALGSADGHILVANRGADVITALAETANGLRAVADLDCGGIWPRHFAVRGCAIYVANQMSDRVTRICTPSTSERSSSEHSVEVPSPSCIVFSTTH
jgi:6-phosphogluconolactonase (cycloisomerase 2 family)